MFHSSRTQANSSKGVNGHTTNIACCHSGRSCDRDRVFLSDELFTQGGDDFSEQNRFAGTYVLQYIVGGREQELC